MKPSHLAAFLAVVAAVASSTGCIAGPRAASALPSTLYFREQCPLAEYEVVKEFTISDRGFGLFYLPIDGADDLAKEINAEVGRVGGDAVIDLQIRSDIRAIIYFIIFFEIYPRHEISGKVIRFLSEECYDYEAGA